ncbi:MAG: hypothetical protein A2Y61_06555 [Chloroflexi bacterium RBG_13_60_13]|nr:MAG: hypothetical protein A2Y61_06555 [Chloroflexi bacterium RBG_13_60_13]
MSTDESLHFVQELLRADEDEIIGGLLRGLFKLDDPCLATLFAEMAGACRARFLRRAELPADIDMDGFIERMRLAGPGRIDIQRAGNEIVWSEIAEGQCSCPLVRLGVVELNPKLCACSVEWLRGVMEKFHDGDVAVELVESVANGSQSCVFRVKLLPPRS